MNKPRILVYASGSAQGGGSGFANLVKASREGLLDAEICKVISNHADGGVKKYADELGIPFAHFHGPWTAEKYQEFANDSGADFFALSGWLKIVTGLDSNTKFNSKTVFNIHPGPLPQFGGTGMYGHHVHKAVIEAYKRGEIKHSAVCMHFVTEGYDRGPVFLQFKVKIEDNDTPESISQHINSWEHHFQPIITDMVVKGKIHWDGINPSSLICPTNYSIS